MIQRIQSLWLLAAAALGLISLKTSFYSGHRIKDAIPKPVVFLTGSYNILLIICTTTFAVLSLVAIFLYKNRKLQIRIGILSLLLSLATIALYFWQSQSFVPGESSYDLTSVIPIAVPIFLFLAIRGIYKDEKLVRSADRLR
ncbi:MAG TPA: DUF4293 domain-containing protein [Chitinophagaceae bacterium]|nr:DUF4293 domain-containing protein [Chitinophagaceae bacterium]